MTEDSAPPPCVTFPTSVVVPMSEVYLAVTAHALRVSKGRIKAAAEMLGVGRATLYRWMDQYSVARCPVAPYAYSGKPRAGAGVPTDFEARVHHLNLRLAGLPVPSADPERVVVPPTPTPAPDPAVTREKVQPPTPPPAGDSPF